MMSTRKGDGGSRNFPRVRVLFFSNNRSIVHLCGWRGMGVTKLSFFVDVINV